MLSETTTPIRVIVPDRPIGGGHLAPELRLTLYKTGEVTLEATEEMDHREATSRDIINRAVGVWHSQLYPGDVAVANPDAVENIAGLFQPLVDRVRAGSTIRRRGGFIVVEHDADAEDALHSMTEEFGAMYPEDWVLEPQGLIMGKRVSGTGETSC